MSGTSICSGGGGWQPDLPDPAAEAPDAEASAAASEAAEVTAAPEASETEGAAGAAADIPEPTGGADAVASTAAVESDSLVEVVRAGGPQATALVRELLRADLDGTNPGGIDRLAEGLNDPEALGFILTDAIDDDLHDWIQSDSGLRARAEEIVLDAAPTDPSIEENGEVNAQVDDFERWDDYPYDVIVVPGFSPRNGAAEPGVHRTTRKRLERAKKDFDDGKAPFVLLSGGNVWPRGTQYHEALEMKEALADMGVPADRIIVDARARHSTTNLRNAGRYMNEHGMKKALVTTTFGQDFYFSFPGISSFNHRSRKDLGYEVGRLRDVAFRPGHSSFEPSQDVGRINIRDPLDP